MACFKPWLLTERAAMNRLISVLERHTQLTSQEERKQV
jgi:hypothetical protein